MIRTAMVGAMLLACIGCADSDSRGVVSGSVSYDGQPLTVGMAAFEPVQGGHPRYIPIQNGRFEAAGRATLEPASYRVRITGSNAAPTAPPTDGPARTLEELHAQAYSEEEHTQMLPDAWNVASELTVEVTVGRNTFHFRGGKDEEPTVSPN